MMTILSVDVSTHVSLDVLELLHLLLDLHLKDLLHLRLHLLHLQLMLSLLHLKLSKGVPKDMGRRWQK